MIVVDVGCLEHETEDSIGRLIRRFKPEILFGFDPLLEDEAIEVVLGGTVVVTRRLAAWTHVGSTTFSVSGIRSGIDPNGRLRVDTFDFPEWLSVLPEGTILKINAEGAEYPLLWEIHEKTIDDRLALVIVQWHEPEDAHSFHAERVDLSCPTEDWFLW